MRDGCRASNSPIPAASPAYALMPSRCQSEADMGVCEEIEGAQSRTSLDQAALLKALHRAGCCGPSSFAGPGLREEAPARMQASPHQLRAAFSKESTGQRCEAGHTIAECAQEAQKHKGPRFQPVHSTQILRRGIACASSRKARASRGGDFLCPTSRTPTWCLRSPDGNVPR